MNAKSLFCAGTLALACAMPSIGVAQQNYTKVNTFVVDRPDLKSFLEESSAPTVVGRAQDYAAAGRSGALGRLPPRHLRALVNGSEAIDKLLKGKKLVAELDGSSVAELDDARRRIIAVMAKFDPKRIICRETVTLGSRFPVNHCMTVEMAIAQEENSRESARYAIDGLRCIAGEGQPCKAE